MNTDNLGGPKRSPSNSSSCSIVPTTREVIGDQLLVALDDKTKVAVVCDQNDIELLMWALANSTGGLAEQRGKMWQDLKKLRDAAFG